MSNVKSGQIHTLKDKSNEIKLNDKLVKSCYKLESGLRLGQEGVHACQLGPFSSPIYYTEEEAGKKKITKKMIMEKRKWIFDMLNDDHSETPCKGCSMVIYKKPEEVRFDQLGHMDIAATTTCNLRCNFCGYTVHDSFDEAKYDALDILEEFDKTDVTWNSAVDFNGGEPTLLKDFDRFLSYFNSRGVRVFLFTNGLIYKQSVYDGLINGTVRWAIVSLDAGTKATYKKMKKSPKFNQVLENIARYSEAGNLGGGNCSVKYIFHEDNSNDEDINGFAYAMLALRPQEVWLTFDFDPLCDLPADAPNLGGLDYSKHVEYYAKAYLLLEKHGFKPVHYAEKHLAPASQHGILLLKMVKEKIESLRKVTSEQMKLGDFRKIDNINKSFTPEYFRLSPHLDVKTAEGWKKASLKGKRVAIAPASPRIKDFISSLSISGADIIGILDRDKVLHGKEISGKKVYSYAEAKGLNLDMVFVANTNNVIEAEIAQSISNNTENTSIYLFIHEQSSEYDMPTVAVKDYNEEGTNLSGQKAVKELIQWARHT